MSAFDLENQKEALRRQMDKVAARMKPVGLGIFPAAVHAYKPDEQPRTVYMRPTMNLRISKVTGKLQQQFLDDQAMKQEWRDVPMEE